MQDIIPGEPGQSMPPPIPAGVQPGTSADGATSGTVAQQHGWQPLPPRPQQKRRRLGRWLRIVPIAVLALSGALVQSFREAKADPSDLKACTETAAGLESDGETFETMLASWSGAKDGKISGQVGPVVAAAQAQNGKAFEAALNKVIGRCQEISEDFRTRFDSYCKANKGACSEKFNLF